MNWIKYNGYSTLSEGSICRTSDGVFIIAGEINTSRGVNDEFTETITHYTDDNVSIIAKMIEDAKNDFKAISNS